MRTLELFAGHASFSKVARDRGHDTFTVDIDPKFKPDLVKDVTELDLKDLPYQPQVLWASPPCQKFSVARISTNWFNDGNVSMPRNQETWEARKLVLYTMGLIKLINPRLWFVENPVGMLRAQGFMQNYPRRTVSYCKYGDTRKKPTDIWTNSQLWKPRPICRPSIPCGHEKTPRGSTAGTQKIRDPAKRAEIPYELMLEIVKACEEEIPYYEALK